MVASIIIWFLGYFPRHSESGDQFDRQIAEIENTELDSQEKTDTIEELERLKQSTTNKIRISGVSARRFNRSWLL